MNPFMDMSSSLRPPGSPRFGVLFSSRGNKNLFSGSSADEDKRMNEEEAESAEILFWEPLESFGLLDSVRNGPPFSYASLALSV